MTGYLIRRSIFLVLSLMLAMLVIFVLLRALPGDPANALLSVDATPEQVAAARAQVGSDKPILTELITWVGNIARLKFGESFVGGYPVLPEIVDRLSVTIPLTLIAFTISILAAAVIGYLAAARAESPLGVFISGISQVGIAVPVFWVGILLVWIFALQLGWFPSGGFPPAGWARPDNALASLALPVATIVVVMTASLVRYVRAATLDVLDSDYLRNARALGATGWEAFARHGLRNSVVPIISILGIELASTLLGAVVVESVFSLPGLGSMLTKAIAQHDYPSIQAVLLVTTFLVLIIGFVADIVQRLIDPRLRSSLTGSAS